ncbi:TRICHOHYALIN [Salix purpurea]|uniref:TRICHOHYALIN n=1 Tax=Salix purpurea TaxID=77065 RepID=A0A9Q0THG6_SALPP|nr:TRICHOHYALIN [Salix purpurea]
MAADYAFKVEDMEIDEGFGFPRAYAKLCRDRGIVGTCTHGPPFAFTPYAMEQHEVLRTRELDQMFPVIEPKAKQTAKPEIFISRLWRQLDHLGNAGFDPAVIRVDPYGNVLYFHADKASPLAWDIDHWFPCPRGGLTVPSNLRILQWQVCKRKHHKLEFLVPWWDLQLGISVNQFLSIFASSSSDFRESYDSSLALKSLDHNRQIRPHSPAIASRKMKSSALKENESSDFVTNPYQAIVMARDSLKQKEAAHKMQAEILNLDDEVNEIKRNDEEEKLTIQDLELTLIKRRRRAEKCRRLAEAQSSYRTMLERMIRDAMHQSVVYKEKLRLNQAATRALMARLEAQKAICDASEEELHKKYKQRDELEKQIRPEWEQGRKRSRMDDTLPEDADSKTVLYLPGIRTGTPLHRELREFLEEQKATEAGLPANEDTKHNKIEKELKQPEMTMTREEHDKSIIVLENEIPSEHKLQALKLGEGKREKTQFSVIQDQEIEEDEESRKQRGKGNVERWLQLLLENSGEEIERQNSNGCETNTSDDIITKLNKKFPQEARSSTCVQGNDKGKRVEEIIEIEPLKEKGNGSVGGEAIANNNSFDKKERIESQKERALTRSESARTLRRIPSSTLILGMRKESGMHQEKAHGNW